ncbi:MAG: hypothetical protein PHQ40_00355 [Anaerolineaceae bacterium]|nr:hypothetical protein [Anaerolineaceae bacterium]MDD5367507.1 hypothetical protein [Anaerolineaceae bacterium]
MTRELSLSDGTVTLNFLTGTLLLKDATWGPKTGSDSVWETMELFSVASDANTRTSVVQLEGLFEASRRYSANPIEASPVWLTWQSEGETAKRSLVLDGTLEILPSAFSGPLMGRGRLNLRVAIQRQALYEAATPTAYTPGPLSATGGKAALAALGGAVEGRIASLTISSASVAAGLSRIWVGLRPLRNGTTGFISVWECEAGTVNIGNPMTDSEVIDDASASDGHCVRVNFTMPQLYWRNNLYLSDIATTNLDDFVGRYLVLGRVKVDAYPTQVALQLQHGWMGFSRGSIVGTTYISGQTGWKLVELGQVQLPPTGYRGTGPGIGNGMGDYALKIFAERISPAGALYLDCLILVPAEHLLIVDGVWVDTGGGELAAYINPTEGDQYAIGSQANGILGNIDFSFSNWQFPPGGALLVMAAQNATFHDLTPTLTPVFSVYPRWRGLRT